MSYQNTTKSVPQRVADFLANNWIVVLAILVGYPILKKYWIYIFGSIEDQQRERAKDEDFEYYRNENNRQAKFTTIWQELASLNQYDGQYSPDELRKAGERLGHELGTVYSDTDSWWSSLDPRGWSENDNAVEAILMQYGDYYWALVQGYYFYTRSRDLSRDLDKLLNNSNKERLRESGFAFI